MTSTSQTDLSIVIVNWNTKDFIRDCIQSIIATTHQYAYEIIVVDNGSSDGSQQMVRSNFPEVKLIENRFNVGFAKANNQGILASRGNYISLVNSDVIVLENCFEMLLAYMNNHPDVGMVGPKLLNADRTLQVSCKKQPTIWNNACLAFGLNKVFPYSRHFCGEHLWHFNHDEIIDSEALVGAFIFARKSAINEVGLMDEKFFFYGEEIDWCKRFWDKGYKVRFFPYARSIHFGAGSSSKEPLKFYRQLYISKIIYYNKHFKPHYRNMMITIQIARQLLRLIMSRISHNNVKATDSKIKQLSPYKDVALLLISNINLD